MKCPHCRSSKTDVFNTRSTSFGTQIWRRRRCLECNKPFTTYEQPDLSFLKVQNDTKKPAPYSRARLFSSIYLSFEGIKAEAKTIDAVTDTVEAKILELKLAEVTPLQIAEIVLSALKHFSMPAFLSYMSKHTIVANKSDIKNALKRY
jgi:transcriptional repressor NrdR